MEISLISPAAIQSSNGNFTTAIRWKRILQALGHQVELSQEYDNTNCDLMIALHAWRSAEAIQRYKSLFPNKPLIVALTGTDAYRFIHSHSQQTLNSIALADCLVGLHQLISYTLPITHQHKLNVIFQASTLKPLRIKKIKRNFNVCIAGHLRDEKDPLRTAYAARLLPHSSKIYISHFGKAHDKAWEGKARLENIRNNRYQWYGEITQSLLRVKFSQAKLLVLSSHMEGGANIISEAVMSNLPIVASNISGTVGLLGKDYKGYYEVGNTQQLKQLLLRCESDLTFYQTLAKQCHARRHLFSPLQEKLAWAHLLEQLT